MCHTSGITLGMVISEPRCDMGSFVLDIGGALPDLNENITAFDFELTVLVFIDLSVRIWWP